jgi:hypothetical protein
MKHTHSTSPRSILGCCLLLFSSLAGAQEIVSRTLTDAIYRGDGVIDLLKDVSGDQLTKYFNQSGGLLLLGVDINEDNSGNESRSSLGIAIKQAQLSITTTAGDFTFGDFYTSTTAMLREAGGTTSAKYYTMFGQGGSSQLTGKSGFNLSSFDDVLWLEKIALTGTILRAELSITFLETLTSRSSDAESFFDFSGGFEDFALLSAADAVLLEEAAIGTADAPPGVAYTTGGSATGAIVAAAPAAEGAPPLATPPAAPAPPWLMVAGLAGLLLLKPKKAATHETP